MKKAFTLAEVLITLGIIGVVAALTLPSLIAKYQKLQTVTKLKKFYANMSEAIKRSEVENGSAEDWNVYKGLADGSYADALDFYNKYLKEYLIVTKIQQCNSVNLCLYFPDGTSARIRPRAGMQLYFYTKKPANTVSTRDGFLFEFLRGSCSVPGYESTYQLRTYCAGWNGTRADLFTNTNYSCSKTKADPALCSRLIQYDGWEIAPDYPW